MLEYLALGMILLSVTAIFYIFIFIHDLPHHVAKHRNHPHVDAIHAACWLSLFTLHAIWPLVFIWALSNRGPINVRVVGEGEGEVPGSESNPGASLNDEVASLKETVATLQAKLAQLESSRGGAE